MKKIRQICTSVENGTGSTVIGHSGTSLVKLYALCEDDTVYQRIMDVENAVWFRVPGIPEDEEGTDEEGS